MRGERELEHIASGNGILGRMWSLGGFLFVCFYEVGDMIIFFFVSTIL